MSAVFDLNADLGEGFGVWSLTADVDLLDTVTSANVACGFHAGDASTMRRVCAAAAARGVAVGAHVGYRDLAGFGRRRLDVDPGPLADEVVYQLGALQACARAEGAAVSYVKPHGALYNRTVEDEVQAGAVVGAVVAAGGLAVLGLPGSSLLRLAAAAGLRAVTEAFADRGYTAAGTLVPRSHAGALLTDEASVVAQAVSIATTRTVRALDGTRVAVDAESLCLHGDSPGAVAAAQAVSIATTRTVRALDGTRVAVDAESLCLHGDSPGAVAAARAVRAALTDAGVGLRSWGSLRPGVAERPEENLR